MIMRMKIKRLRKNFIDNNPDQIFTYNTFVVPLENFSIDSFDCSRM